MQNASNLLKFQDISCYIITPSYKFFPQLTLHKRKAGFPESQEPHGEGYYRWQHHPPSSHRRIYVPSFWGWSA
ncbi:hypothetical protein MTBLM1_20266 [Rhodospirillaceae bacterium LM-1]|nr:hypothetical protein MTBLM1_20266 [Rhodospirillaceae bacterium LM-1]